MFDFSEFPELSTARLRLRQLSHDDASEIMILFGAPEMMTFRNDNPIDSPASAIEVIDRLNREFHDHAGIDWGITLHKDNRLIGMCGTYKWHPSDRCIDIGYFVEPPRWGQGIATEATRAMLGWCFSQLGAHRVQADCTAGHSASERVMLKCGFTFEGLWRESCWEHGRFVSIKQFGLLENEFQSA